jgi:hypothetical protein
MGDVLMLRRGERQNCYGGLLVGVVSRDARSSPGGRTIEICSGVVRG